MPPDHFCRTPFSTGFPRVFSQGTQNGRKMYFDGMDGEVAVEREQRPCAIHHKNQSHGQCHWNPMLGSGAVAMVRIFFPEPTSPPAESAAAGRVMQCPFSRICPRVPVPKFFGNPHVYAVPSGCQSSMPADKFSTVAVSCANTQASVVVCPHSIGYSTIHWEPTALIFNPDIEAFPFQKLAIGYCIFFAFAFCWE